MSTPSSLVMAQTTTCEADAARQFSWRGTLNRLAAFFPWLRRYEHPRGRAGFVVNTLGGFVSGTILDVGAGRNATVFADKYGQAYHPLDIGGSYHVESRPNAVLPDTIVD